MDVDVDVERFCCVSGGVLWFKVHHVIAVAKSVQFSRVL